MDYLLTTLTFYWTIKRTMSRSHVKRYIIPLCFSFWNVAGHSSADNRVNVNRHDAQCVKESLFEKGFFYYLQDELTILLTVELVFWSLFPQTIQRFVQIE